MFYLFSSKVIDHFYLVKSFPFHLLPQIAPEINILARCLQLPVQIGRFSSRPREWKGVGENKLPTNEPQIVLSIQAKSKRWQTCQYFRPRLTRPDGSEDKLTPCS